MKHLLRYSLMCALSLLWGTSFAQTEVKFDFDNGDAALFGLPGVSCNADEENGIAESHDGDFTQDATATKDGVSITVSAAEEGAKNANRIWNKSAVLRMYSGTLTIEAPGHQITKIVINYSKDKWQADSKPDTGAFTSSTNQTTIWEGSSSKVVIKIAGNSQMKDITVTLDGESGGQGSGDTSYGTAEAPLTVAEALAIATALDKDAKTPEGVDVYTKGVVTEITTAWSSQYKNVSFNFSNDGGTTKLLVYRCKAETEDYVLAGDEVVIKGTLKNYKGDTPEYDAGCEIISLVQGSGHSGTTPETPEEIDVAKALEIVSGLADKEKTEKEYIVSGYVVGTPDYQRKDGVLYGNVNLTIADEAGGTPTLTIFRGKSYDNADFTEETLNLFSEGDLVVFQGKLQKYGETPELVNGYLIKVEKATGIQSVKAQLNNGAIYNLAGQRVEKATKGIYIMNGKKVIVK
ncbi:MAG: hypothetical protein IKX65_03510 [Prevotella sp.]|nr:hypothetical protein [Prevotella sp.]